MLRHGHRALARPGAALLGVPAISLNGQYIVGTLYHPSYPQIAVFLLDAPNLNLALSKERPALSLR
jgi:hypothetical protein